MSQGAEENEPEDSGDASSDKIGIQSVEIGMRLLNALVDHALDTPPPMLKTLAANAGMPPAKAHRYMVSLVRAGLAERDPTTERYRLGSAARQMGIRSLQGLDVVRLASGRLEAISATIEQSVALAIWTYVGPMIVAQHDYRGPVTIGTRIGEVMPLTASASGLVYAAWAPARTRAILQKEIAENRQKKLKPDTMIEVGKRLEQVREIGIGQTEGGLSVGVNAVSAPIFDFRGELVGALTALGSSHDFAVAVDGHIAQTIIAQARMISTELGYLGEHWTSGSR